MRNWKLRFIIFLEHSGEFIIFIENKMFNICTNRVICFLQNLISKVISKLKTKKEVS